METEIDRSGETIELKQRLKTFDPSTNGVGSGFFFIRFCFLFLHRLVVKKKAENFSNMLMERYMQKMMHIFRIF